MCVYSNSRNDVPRVAQRYGTIAANTRRCASVLVMFVVLCVHMHSFAGLIRRTPPPTFSDTAITDLHSDTTIFQLMAHWVRIFWSIGSEKSLIYFLLMLHKKYAMTSLQSRFPETALMRGHNIGFYKELRKIFQRCHHFLI